MAGEACMRIVLVIINIIFTILGLCYFVIGLILRFGRSLLDRYIDLEELADSIPNIGSSYGADTNSGGIDVDGLLTPLAVFLIVFGLFFLIMGISGMIGACCTVKCMLIIYIVVVGLVLLGEIIIFIMLLTNFAKKEVKSYLEDKMKNDYKGIDDYSMTGLALTYLMIEKKCCGVDNFNIFNESTVFERTRNYTGSGGTTVTLITPIACCKMNGNIPDVTLVDEQCAYQSTETNNNMLSGCYDKIEDDIDSNKNGIIGGMVGLILFAALCLIFAILILRKTLKDQSEIV